MSLFKRRILYLQYSNPAVYPSLQHSSRFLADHGWNVRFFGIRAIGTDQVQPDAHPRIRWTLWAGHHQGWILKLHYVFFGLWSLLWAWLWRPEWIYVSDPEACPIACLISFFSPARVLYHEHDSPTPRPGRVWMNVIYACRRRIARAAELTIQPNEQRLLQFQEEMHRNQNTYSVWNCPSLTEMSASRVAASDETMIVLYQGSLVPERLSLTIVDALARMPSGVSLVIVGYETVGHRGYTDQLRRYADQLKLGHRLKIMNGLLRSDLVALGQRCDVGLAFQPKVPNDMNSASMVGASNKIYEYLGNGLALLISDAPHWKESFIDPGYARSCRPDDIEDVVRQLQWFFDHPVERRDMGERGRLKVMEDWNYEKRFLPVFRRLEEERS